MNNATSSQTSRAFPNTRWSLVLAIRQPSAEAAVALETICRDYWYPLYAYARSSGKSAHDAQDLTQEFFCRLLEKRWLDAADSGKGRLRSFLIVAMKRFMNNEWDRASAQRRGGGLGHAQIDTAFAEGRFAADANILAPDETYDRQWALTLIRLTTDRLRAEFTAEGKPKASYDILKNCLLADRGGIDYADVAKGLGTTEGAARVMVHRLRKRFREIYREEISQTLAEGADLEVEMRHLAAALV